MLCNPVSHTLVDLCYLLNFCVGTKNWTQDLVFPGQAGAEPLNSTPSLCVFIKEKFYHVSLLFNSVEAQKAHLERTSEDVELSFNKMRFQMTGRRNPN